MAELDVQIDARGAKRGGDIVVRQLDRIRGAATRASGGLDKTDKSQKAATRSGMGLGRVLGIVAASLAVKKIFEYSDAWTLANNRIRLVTESQEELAAVTEQVFVIAQDARIGLASTAELYARIARSSDTLGLSQQRVLDVTKSVSQAITISGVSAQSADAAIVQLGQGLAAGALRGDELRSVLEQTPRLARAIADGLGVPIGALRELGAAGELSAEKVVKALESQADVLNKEFGTTTATISQSFAVLENSIIKSIGLFSDSTGAAGGFAQVIIGLADFITEDFTPGLLRFGDILGVTINEFSRVGSTIGDSFD